MDYKIGDIVNHTFDGRDCKIIADKDTPYKSAFGDVFPRAGGDFVLLPLTPRDGKRDYIYNAFKEHLQPPLSPHHE